MHAETLLDKLAGDEVPLGMVLHISDPAIVEIAALAGYDWVSYTLEHTDLTGVQIEAIQRAADARGIPTLLHVPTPDDPRILPALGAGVGGIVLSRARSKAHAVTLVETVRFPPLGLRGAHSGMRTDGYGSEDYGAFVAEMDAKIAVGLAIEDVDGVQDAVGILGTPGLSMAFIGMMDLSHSLGIPGEYDSPLLLDAVREVIRVADSFGVPIGLPHYGHSLTALRGFGARLILTPGTDHSFIYRTLKGHISSAREEVARAASATSGAAV
jgi:4-hydroxy-2-oxoheptanedioate aldolase